MNKGLVSIIVPIYNVEKYLRECVDSLVKQSYDNIEIILIDDGSTDNSGKISDEYLSYDNVRVYHKENGGLSDARNFGIEHSKGEFLAFVDSDDYVAKDYILKMLNKIKESDIDIVACSYYDVSEDRQVLGKVKSVNRILDEKKFWNDVYISGNATTAYSVAWNKLYKRDVFENLRYREGILNEDDDIIYDIIHKRRMFMMGDLLYYYRQRQGSIMNQMKKSFNIERIKLIYRRLDKFQENEQLEYLPYVLLEIAAVIINGLAISVDNVERKQCYNQLDELKIQKKRVRKMGVKTPIKLYLKFCLYLKLPRFSAFLKKIKMRHV